MLGLRLDENQKDIPRPFPPGRVYDAWVSSDTVIAPATRMDIDPVVGGHYRLFMDASGYSAANEGVFLDVKPGSRLSYSRVRITHAGFAAARCRLGQLH